MNQPDKDTLWYQPDLDVFLNRWYSSYADARKALAKHGGFLLSYKNHFFVCAAEVIRALGLEPEDHDWGRIGCDVAQPCGPGGVRALASEASDRCGRLITVSTIQPISAPQTVPKAKEPYFVFVMFRVT
jgi:hypothetical protein